MSSKLKTVTITLLLVLVVVSTTALSAQSAPSPEPSPARASVAFKGSSADIGAALGAYTAEAHRVGEYIATVQQVGSYIQSVAQQEQAAEAARQAELAQQQQQQQYITAPAPSGGATGACGGATNGADQYINRESGGDPTITNGGGHAASPYDSGGLAWGCYQIMPGTWEGACGPNNTLGLPPITSYDPASQAECASRLSGSAWAL